MSKKSRLCRICDRNNKVIPVRDVLGILRFSALLYTEDTTTILPLRLQLKCGQVHFENWTYNAGKPPKKAVFQRKVVRVTGFEPAASCSQSRRATNCATPGYFIFLHDTMRRRKKQVFRVCGWRCGQARFCGGIFRRGISAASYCPKDFRSSAFGGMDESSILPKQARYQLRYTRIIWFSCMESVLCR